MERIRSGNFGEDTDHRDHRRARDIEAELQGETIDDEEPTELVRELRDHQAAQEPLIRRFGADYFENLRDLLLFEIQRRYLRMTERHVRRGVINVLTSANAKAAPLLDALRELPLQNRNLLLTRPFTIGLGNAPRKTGEGNVFRASVRKALETFKRHHPVLFPVRTLLSIIVLYVPPTNRPTKAQEVGVDLDNLAIKIIPEVLEFFRPPSTPLRALQITDPRLDRAGAFWIKRLELEKRFPRESVTRCELIAFPMFKQDANIGQVSLALCDGLVADSTVDYVDSVLNRWGRTVE